LPELRVSAVVEPGLERHCVGGGLESCQDEEWKKICSEIVILGVQHPAHAVLLLVAGEEVGSRPTVHARARTVDALERIPNWAEWWSSGRHINVRVQISAGRRPAQT
jgi:hypothetical protein